MGSYNPTAYLFVMLLRSAVERRGAECRRTLQVYIDTLQGNLQPP
jgi:hypothetical protein